jgi:D-amino-acid dehydrogenase
MNFVLAAGGTGGHMVPAHALAAELKSRGHGVLLITDDRGAPRISVTDFKRKVVYARIGDELRVAGMADLSGRRAEIDVERVDQLVDEVRAAFPRASDFSSLKPWCGMRPATPKGTPVIGATPHANLFLNVGHGALGFTLALATGRILADLVAGRAPAVPLEGFTLH